MAPTFFNPKSKLHRQYLTNTGQLPTNKLQVSATDPQYEKARIVRIRKQWEDVLRQLDTDSATH